ncbi:hypothetical protein [Aliiruegeria lutimaris]|uniref:Uncharacterized protein n=1 Tax=Aliiruegeria lutimaris TaxID=571298 RepID=A0A1G9DLC4_9RHOB|nr:hypothetical protein [Aliiruegeria lutimaris]SDK64634.1 hypothetical protein SAMN04488026_10489 [Aliiruegeria lutimaris]
MINKWTTIAGVVVLVALAGCVEDTGSASAPASTGGAGDLSDFVGARAGQAEGGLQARGYELIRSEGLTSYWFNRSTGSCAAITTADGRYSDIAMLPAEDC